MGPQVIALLKQKIDSLNNNGNLLKNLTGALLVVYGIQIPFINLGARYELGLSNINDIDNREKWKSQGLTLFAGITF